MKRDINGEIVRFKARLVAQGFSQQYGSDYDEVFAPVVQQTTFRTLMAVAAKKNMTVKQYDVKTAFLNGDLEEEIYMRQPCGFVQRGSEGKVCRLHRSLYGLKQAARAWNQKLHEELVRQRFQRCDSDPCLYRKQVKGRWCYVLVYVDDLVVVSEDPTMIEALARKLKKSFEISELGDIRYYLGMEVEKDQHGDYFLSQRKYIREVVESSGLAEAKASKIPLDPGYIKSDSEGTPLETNTEYQKLIGKVLYIAVNTRPDISTAVSILSRKTNQPTQEDWTELKRVVRYLKGTADYRLRLSRRGETGTITGYSDADWAENRDDRKSHSGFTFKINGGTVSWACRKQTCVALSTAEAEFIALAEAAQEALWLKLLLQELNDEQRVVIHEDNQSCLKIMEREKLTRKMKHIATKFHFTKDLVEKQEIECVYCPSEDMVADLLTKPLARTRLEKLAKLIGLTVAV
ncbi:hypothetical protein RP20_CCG012118 [Aedes albopictus]|nr:hypothetical protein RP20_CCG012118 [Aedes albopictus]